MPIRTCCSVIPGIIGTHTLPLPPKVSAEQMENLKLTSTGCPTCKRSQRLACQCGMAASPPQRRRASKSNKEMRAALKEHAQTRATRLLFSSAVERNLAKRICRCQILHQTMFPLSHVCTYGMDNPANVQKHHFSAFSSPEDSSSTCSKPCQFDAWTVKLLRHKPGSFVRPFKAHKRMQTDSSLLLCLSQLFE